MTKKKTKKDKETIMQTIITAVVCVSFIFITGYIIRDCRADRDISQLEGEITSDVKLGRAKCFSVSSGDSISLNSHIDYILFSTGYIDVKLSRYGEVNYVGVSLYSYEYKTIEGVDRINLNYDPTSSKQLCIIALYN